MKSNVQAHILLLLCCLCLPAPEGLAEESVPDSVKRGEVRQVSADFSLQAGYRTDRLDWNIAGNIFGSNPDILSELTWKDLDYHQLEAATELTFASGRQLPFQLLVRGEAAYGQCVAGRNRDSDYAGDSRTLEFSRSINDADEGRVVDLSGGIGFRFGTRNDRWALIPLVGYSYHQQRLRISDGFQAISDQSIADDFFEPDRLLPPVGPFTEQLDSRYDTEWWGPWLGLELSFSPNSDWKMGGGLQYHFADYQAEANWNLRDDLAHPVSFRHWAEGDGVIMSFAVSRRLPKDWSWSLTAKYQDWQVEDGIDNVYLANGDISGTRLNAVNWQSRAVSFGLVRSF